MRMCIYLEIKAQAAQKSGTGKARMSRTAVAWKAEAWFFVLARGSAAGVFFRRRKP